MTRRTYPDRAAALVRINGKRYRASNASVTRLRDVLLTYSIGPTLTLADVGALVQLDNRTAAIEINYPKL